MFQGQKHLEVKTIDFICEVYPWVEGDTFQTGNISQLRELGEKLALFHTITSRLQLKSKKGQVREDNPDRLEREVDLFLSEVQGEKEAIVRRIKEHLQKLKSQFPDEFQKTLPQTIIHGDLHTGNVKFGGNRLAGLFDFDWTNRQARVRDVGDLLIFFASRGENR